MCIRDSDMTGRELRNLRTKMQIIFQDPFSSLSPVSYTHLDVYKRQL